MSKLFLLPNLLDEEANVDDFFPVSLKQIIPRLQGLIAESEKEGRRYLLKFITRDRLPKILTLNEHTQDLESLLIPLRQGEIWGLVSDAGLPCIADPGSDLVFLAKQNGIEVEAIVGPCSLILALQLSGFSGQRFAFHGYLPRETEDLEEVLRRLEKEARMSTQIWIEAPYRSLKMFDIMKAVLSSQTKLCIATDLTTKNQRVVSQTIAKWQSISFPLGKAPCVFLLS